MLFYDKQLDLLTEEEIELLIEDFEFINEAENEKKIKAKIKTILEGSKKKTIEIIKRILKNLQKPDIEKKIWEEINKALNIGAKVLIIYKLLKSEMVKS